MLLHYSKQRLVNTVYLKVVMPCASHQISKRLEKAVFLEANRNRIKYFNYRQLNNWWPHKPKKLMQVELQRWKNLCTMQMIWNGLLTSLKKLSSSRFKSNSKWKKIAQCQSVLQQKYCKAVSLLQTASIVFLITRIAILSRQLQEAKKEKCPFLVKTMTPHSLRVVPTFPTHSGTSSLSSLYNKNNNSQARNKLLTY
jgi:hypothetical protein